MQTYDLEFIELLGQTGHVLLVSESYGGENHFTALVDSAYPGDIYLLIPTQCGGGTRNSLSGTI